MHGTIAQPMTVQTLAQKMLQDAGGDMNVAANKMVAYVATFPRLAAEILKIGARTLINEVPQLERRVIEQAHSQREFTPQTTRGPHRMNAADKKARERVINTGAFLRDMWLNAPYTIGSKCKPMKDWVGTELAAHGETQVLSGMTQTRNGRFLVAVGTAAGNRTVGYALKEEDILRIREDVMKTAE